MKIKNTHSIYTWVKKVIDSCKTNEQLENCKNLVNNFKNNTLKGKTNGTNCSMIYLLDNEINIKQNKINEKNNSDFNTSAFGTNT